MEFFGEIAALATGLCWAMGTLFFTEAGKLIGSYKVNKIRLVLAAVIYIIILLVSKGHIFPENLMWEHVFWLGLSGFIGFVIGDGAGFKAMVMIGPRLAMLLHSLAPLMAALVAWIFLGETLNFLDILSMTITIAGISWVISCRKFKNRQEVSKDHPDAGSMGKGIFYGLIFALGQAVGLIMSKHAMNNLAVELQPMEASFIRILVAMVLIWGYAFIRGNAIGTIRAFKDRRAIGYAVGGAMLGPFVGVWMSLLAVKYIAAGIAATLNSTTPIWMLPIVRIVYKEQLSARIIIGTVAAVLGVAMLLIL